MWLVEVLGPETKPIPFKCVEKITAANKYGVLVLGEALGRTLLRT